MHAREVTGCCQVSRDAGQAEVAGVGADDDLARDGVGDERSGGRVGDEAARDGRDTGVVPDTEQQTFRTDRAELDGGGPGDGDVHVGRVPLPEVPERVEEAVPPP
ncbi:hypothetical protein GALL_409990 [mine drainage metagenome]|uniref:Uncharacterized protein n=1 Tax=mine drainage metagenome TaxID=410659 RepID=A0A1J5Q200_9ZZZZ